MLKLGSSKPWPDAMEALTGGRTMSTDALQEYFAPLTAWLEEQNQKNGDAVGWSDTEWRPSELFSCFCLLSNEVIHTFCPKSFSVFLKIERGQKMPVYLVSVVTQVNFSGS